MAAIRFKAIFRDEKPDSVGRGGTRNGAKAGEVPAARSTPGGHGGPGDGGGWSGAGGAWCAAEQTGRETAGRRFFLFLRFPIRLFDTKLLNTWNN